MTLIHRRRFIREVALASLAAPLLLDARAAGSNRKMRMCLSPGSIGVSVDQAKCVELAARHGFEAVEPNGKNLASLSEAQLNELLASMKEKSISFGAANLPTEFRRSDDVFKQGLGELPQLAAVLKRAGVVRVGTWLMSGDNTLTYRANFRQHATRLREVARVLQDQGQRLGLEYVGTPTVRAGQRFHFIHTLTEMKELMEEIGLPNVGVVLDSWHWHMAGETPEAVLSLKNEQIISVDLNDAPSGVPLDRQQDGQRELPCATGVIDVAGFLKALNRVGYDGPVRAEPFNRQVNAMTPDDACAAASAALQKAMALIS